VCGGRGLSITTTTTLRCQHAASHLDPVGGLRVRQRPVQQAAARRLGLAVEGGRRRAGRQADGAQEAGASFLTGETGRERGRTKRGRDEGKGEHENTHLSVNKHLVSDSRLIG